MSIPVVLAQLLVQRQLADSLKADAFLHPHVEQCHSPWLMRGMDAAVQRLDQALSQHDRVVVFGDYDADGTVGAVLLYRFFKRLGLRAQYFIPDRFTCGYGLNEPVLQRLRERGTDLIVTVDNGSTAVSEVEVARRLGMDIIITDHHQLGEELPDCAALVNPNQPGCPYPFKGLCGTGVAYKLAQAFDQHLEANDYWKESGYLRPELERDLDLVGFATIADRMPLLDENRYLVKEGLRLMNPCLRPGMQALVQASGVRGAVTPSVLSHKLVPKINSVGRMDNPALGAKLFLARSLSEARRYANLLLELNRERQNVEQEVWRSALDQAYRQANNAALILMDPSWHPGVMGSIAARAAHMFNKTTFALTLSPLCSEGPDRQLAIGSARVSGNLDLCEMLSGVADLLEKFGGHPAAAGVSLFCENLTPFRERMTQAVEERENAPDQVPLEEPAVDAWLRPEEFNADLAQGLLDLSPFGMNNPEPILGVRHARVERSKIFGGQHVKFWFRGARQVECIAWNLADSLSDVKGPVDLIISPQVYGRTCQEQMIQFRALEVRPAD